MIALEKVLFRSNVPVVPVFFGKPMEEIGNKAMMGDSTQRKP
jgi:hypothetical protein